MSPQRRAELWAKRKKLKHVVRSAVIRARSRDRATAERRARARLLINGGVDLTRDDAAALCACQPTALSAWLYRHTGSMLWPPSEGQVKKLHDICK